MDQVIRLVIVDDHTLMRETWKMVLQRDPRIQVIAECASGEEAIRCAESEKPDIMLMDINMSPVNGFEATRKITKAHPSIRIIGLSINNQPAYAKNMLQLGAKGYVTKNSPSEELLDAIKTVSDGGIYICREVKDKFPEDNS
ncbi:MAG TPA: response regulator transcription factor [Flavisolibacter sp.]|jgi:DNA-binding NarL/FixJ family response regulator|nr:response regulator transcription factor [Flavisolibacter sp.]